MLCWLADRGLGAQVLGLIAAIPAVGLAFVAQLVLANWKDTIKKLSGWGLFVFALIFIIKGFKRRAAAKAEQVAAANHLSTARPDESVDVSPSTVAGGEIAPASPVGFTVGTAEERAKDEIVGLTGNPAPHTVHHAARAAHAAPPHTPHPHPHPIPTAPASASARARLSGLLCARTVLCTPGWLLGADDDVGGAVQTRPRWLAGERREIRAAVPGYGWRGGTRGFHWLRKWAALCDDAHRRSGASNAGGAHPPG